MAERKKEGKGFNAEGAEGRETECLTEGWRLRSTGTQAGVPVLRDS